MTLPDPAQPPSGIELAPGVYVDDSALRLGYARSSGPGGQNVNKLNTKVELWLPLQQIRGMHPEALQRLKALAGKRLTLAGDLHLTAETSRTQEANRAAVFEKLRQLIIRAGQRPKVRHKTRPSKASKRRRLEGKRRRGEIKARRRGIGREE